MAKCAAMPTLSRKLSINDKFSRRRCLNFLQFAIIFETELISLFLYLSLKFYRQNGSSCETYCDILRSMAEAYGPFDTFPCCRTYPSQRSKQYIFCTVSFLAFFCMSFIYHFIFLGSINSHLIYRKLILQHWRSNFLPIQQFWIRFKNNMNPCQSHMDKFLNNTIRKLINGLNTMYAVPLIDSIITSFTFRMLA